MQALLLPFVQRRLISRARGRARARVCVCDACACARLRAHMFVCALGCACQKHCKFVSLCRIVSLGRGVACLLSLSLALLRYAAVDSCVPSCGMYVS